MSDLKEIVNGTQEKVLQETIDATTLYNITDLFEIVTATNATMTTEYMQSGFYKKDAYVLCTDDGTYTKGMLYKFGGFSFIPFASIPEVVKAISALSTDAQVPSAKLLYDKLVELQSLYAPKESVQISDGGELNGIVRDTASNIFQGTINKDKVYSITDLDSISMNNAQMTNALLPAQEGLIKPNSIRFCTDNGTYEKDNFYQFTVNYATGTASWVKVEMGGGPIAEAIRDNTTQIASSNGSLLLGGANSATIGIAIGYGARAQGVQSICLGQNASTHNNQTIYGIAIGGQSSIAGNIDRGIAIGYGANVSANYAIQLGQGTNSTANTFQIFNDNIYNHSTHTLTVQNATVNGKAIHGTTQETTTIETTDWTALLSSDPYTYQATITATATIGANSIVELFNDNAVTFATYGFAIGGVSGQNITIYSIGQPSVSVDLTIGIGG